MIIGWVTYTQAHGKLRLRLMAVRLYNCREVNKKAAQGSITKFFTRIPHQKQIEKKEPEDNDLTSNFNAEEMSQVPAASMSNHPTCPICGQSIPADEALSNQHVDECLNKSAIKEMLQAETQDRLQQPTPSTPPRPRHKAKTAGPLDAFIRGKGK